MRALLGRCCCAERLPHNHPWALTGRRRYLYTDELDFDDNCVIDVMRLSHEYRLERPYNHCVRHCRRQISIANAVSWFIQADQYGLDDLRDSTFKFVARNFRTIRSQHKDSLTQLGQHPELMMEVMMEAM